MKFQPKLRVKPTYVAIILGVIGIIISAVGLGMSNKDSGAVVSAIGACFLSSGILIGVMIGCFAYIHTLPSQNYKEK